jgi:hypothetical protein
MSQVWIAKFIQTLHMTKVTTMGLGHCEISHGDISLTFMGHNSRFGSTNNPSTQSKCHRVDMFGEESLGEIVILLGCSVSRHLYGTNINTLVSVYI